METVLFVCTHNSSRSQIAEGLLREMAGDRFEVFSAGTGPAGVNPLAIRAMAEIGIDISYHTSDHVDTYVSLSLDHVVTVCDSARETCPYLPATIRNLHHSFADPSTAIGSEEARLAGFRRVRDEIRDWLDMHFLRTTG